ncbi:MAG: Gfo/Idh/MocA family oxidoreductase, partial [Anaerolineales bacterium]|nr:Gfo/Idh/MocA family oxidoreductase [Anaerolineales bacterium]
MEEHQQPVRVGIIGLGYWGPKLARNLYNLPGVTVSMASDLRQERLDDLKKVYPDIGLTRDYKDLLDDSLDAIVIATPVYTHYSLAREALLAGKHVFVEKPLTSSSAHGQELLCLAKERGLCLMIGHTFVYNPGVEAVKRVIQSGELGDVYHLNSTRVNLGFLQPDINVMWDLAPHDLSILSYLLDDDPVKVSALGAVYVNKSRNLPEVIYINLRFKNDVIANLRVSWLDPVKIRRLTVVGSKKMLVYDDISDNKVMLYDKGVDVPPYSITEEEFRASYRNGPESLVPYEWVEPLHAECDHFIECIRTGCASRSGGEAGLKVVKILESAQRSLINGGLELAMRSDTAPQLRGKTGGEVDPIALNRYVDIDIRLLEQKIADETTHEIYAGEVVGQRRACQEELTEAGVLGQFGHGVRGRFRFQRAVLFPPSLIG